MAKRPTTFLAVRVPSARLDPAIAPQICLKTGEVAQVLVPTTAVVTPGWSWALVVAGGLPFFACRRFLFGRTALELPARQVVFERYQRFRQASAGTAALLGILFVWSLATRSVANVVVCVALAIGATSLWRFVLPSVWIDAELEPDPSAGGDRVRLIGVHPHIVDVYR